MSELIKRIDEYYTQKLKEFGATARGVDWNSDESQQLRFEKLINVIDDPGSFSILDYGCGFGSLYPYLKNEFSQFNYTGFDISSAMINEAKKLFPEVNVEWIQELEDRKKYDYVVASGIFNVKLQQNELSWVEYMHQTINELNGLATKGFSFNVLSLYSDSEKRKEYLYYAEPSYWFDYCKKKFSYQVALLHDYPLYEFTIHVKK